MCEKKTVTKEKANRHVKKKTFLNDVNCRRDHNLEERDSTHETTVKSHLQNDFPCSFSLAVLYEDYYSYFRFLYVFSSMLRAVAFSGFLKKSILEKCKISS